MTTQLPAAMPFAKRTTLSLVIVVITLAPAIVMLGVTFVGTGQMQVAASWASIPAIAGIVAAATGGRRFAVISAIVMGFLAPLTIVAGLSAVSGAAVMGLMCMTVGRLARFGLNRSAILVPIMLAWPLIDPPTWSGASSVDRLDTAYLLWMASIFFVGGIIPAFAVPWLMRKRPRKEAETHSQREAVPYTIMITALVTVSTFYVLATPTMYGGAFLIAAILVLAPLGQAETLKPTIVRVLATIIGSILLVAIVSQVHSLALVYVIGLVLITAALIARFGPRGWIYYVFMMPATACLNATTLAQVGQLGKQRVVDNVIGGALVLSATAIVIAYSSWSSQRGHTDDVDHEAASITTSTSVGTAGIVGAAGREGQASEHDNH